MECEHVRDAILEAWDEPGRDGVRPEVHAHLSGCPACSAFAARQRALDARLALAFEPPDLSTAFRRTLDARIRHEGPRAWRDFWPDLAHFSGFGLATLVGVALFPFSASVVMGTSAIAALLTYTILTMVRDSFEAAEQPDR